ncbi:hypothetical protein GCM10007269_37130 [Microbacterium murale]|uniref:Secreted protein n=1 Tax=Microbacterium murale TaxID=1081040 RepID=A0ABQ1S2K0_9MICO|nr:hypothetical protein GCM10007269_37130 [Microbacterium murale]
MAHPLVVMVRERRVAMVPVLLVAMARELRVVMAREPRAVRAATRGATAHRVAMTAVPAAADFRSVLVPVVTDRTARATTVRATMTPRSPRTSRPTICIRRRATS